MAWLQLPRPPDLDGERWFKLALCTVLRGEVERSGGDAEAFEARVRSEVPYHPAGRLPERKISNPAASVPGPALEGERALVERLSAVSDPARRLEILFEEDEAGIAARLEDPFDLGPAYDPAVRLGAPASWEALARWAVEPAFGEAVRRTLPARWALVEGRPGQGSGWLPAMAAALGSSASAVPWDEGRDASSLAAILAEQAPSVSDRLVLVAEEAGVPILLQALAAHATLRDQVLAVLSVAGVIGGRTDVEGPLGAAARADWMAANFDQAGMDTEVVRLTPYLSVQRLDRGAWPPGLPGLPLSAQRFPEPGQADATVRTVEVVDLGPLWAAGGPGADAVARALIAVVAGWVASRR